ncbi:MAG TPA: diguanylate cyclase [Candidatus Kapabacteria bacterium]|nr:diguanylate cyclase [Candidatus Kapabacteria bacterium]
MAKFKKLDYEKLNSTGKKHTIMLVDDEPVILKELGKFLESEFTVITALSGEEAWDILNKEGHDEISLIISDQRMPGITGVELLERLVVENILPDAIRFILTGYVDLPVIVDAVNKANIYKFILKPYNPDELMLTIKRAIEVYDLRKENKKLSLKDPVTRLGNKNYLNEFLERDIEKIQKDYESWSNDREKAFPPRNNLAFLLLDLDDFKQVNNIHNRKSLDNVLQQLGEILVQHCRKSDISVRWEEEKLLIVCRFIEINEAQKITERLHRKLLQQKIKLAEKQEDINLTCSTGFACYPFIPAHPKALQWSEVVEIAGKALQAAKKSGQHGGYIGLMAAEDVQPDNLMVRIRANIKELLDKGVLQVISCMPGDNMTLVWE